MSNIYPATFGFGLFELPSPDARPTGRRTHDVLVDQRPFKGRRPGKRN